MGLKKIGRRVAKWTGIFLVVFILLLTGLGFYLSRYFDDEVKQYANEHLKGSFNYKRSRLSFFDHFPYLTFTLYDLSLKGAAPFQKDTLLASSELGFGIDLSSLLKGDLVVDKIFVKKAAIQVLVDENGNANYDIYNSGDTTTTVQTEEDEFKLKIEDVSLEQTDLLYDDRSFPLLIRAKGLHYKGSGDLKESFFDLISNADIESFDFNYDNQYYFLSKKIHADLVTRVNTRSLSIAFTKNDLRINQLPIRFTGVLDFLKSGYNMDFQIQSSSTSLKDLITALPQEYLEWLEHTEVQGDANMLVRLSGNYNSETDTWPDLSMKMDIRNGFIANNKAPTPVKELHLDLKASVPELNPDKTQLDLDSLSFRLDQGYFRASLHTLGIDKPKIRTEVHSELDLERLQRAVGFTDLTLKGQCSMHLQADGVYAQEQNPASKKPDTILTSIPSFNLKASLSNGFFQTKSLPGSIQDAGFDLSAQCPDHQYQNTSLRMDRLKIRYLKNFIRGRLGINGGKIPFVDADLHSYVHLADLQRFYTTDSFDVKGDLWLDLVTKGKLDLDRKRYPTTTLSAKIKEGRIQTVYYPRPVEQIELDAKIHVENGNPKLTRIRVQPLSFRFEEQPFLLKMNLENFEDLRYNIQAKGDLDLDHLSQVFTDDDLNISGKIRADFTLIGKQNDLEQQRYHLLNHSGILELKDIETKSVYFPLPFEVHHGLFRFQNDSVRMLSFDVTYGKSKLQLSGAVANILQYYLEDGELRGHLNVKSPYLNINELMASADTNSATTASTTTSAESEGVVIIPPQYNIHVSAVADRIDFNDLHLRSCSGDLKVEKGTLTLNHAGFRLIDAPVQMKATYRSIDPNKAVFEYEIDAREFDIKRAYKEVEMFREMVTAAANAQGKVSLQYRLKGRLIGGMEPVFSSLEGSGTLSLHKIKMKGFKLFNAISKASGKDSLNNQDISNVDIKTTIKNNIITLEPLKMRIAGLWPRIKGQTSFDGQLNLKLRLGLPPLGIVGIPFNITGTQSKPIVKLGRGKNNKDLKETEEEDWE